MKDQTIRTKIDGKNAKDLSRQLTVGCARAFVAPLHYGIDNSPPCVQRDVGLGNLTNLGRGAVPSGVENAIERLRGAGHPLQREVRMEMERAFGVDFSGVRIHADAEADKLSRSLDARAFTTGFDIFFRQGLYSKESTAGSHLLAHELVHVAQQNPGIVRRKSIDMLPVQTSYSSSSSKPFVQAKLALSGENDVHEQEADRTANAYMDWNQHISSISSETKESVTSPQHVVSLARFNYGVFSALPIMRGKEAKQPNSAVPDGIDPSLEREWTVELCRRAGDRMSIAFTKYRAAISTVNVEVGNKQAQPTLLEQLVSVAIGALAPGLAQAIIPSLTKELKAVASVAIGAALKGKDDIAIKAYIKAEDLVDKYIAFDGGTAKSAFLKLSDTVRKQKKVPAPQTAAAVSVTGLLKQLSQDFSVYIDNLNAQIGSADRTAVLGVFAAFDPIVATEDFYAAQIRDLVRKHEEIGEYSKNETGGAFSGLDLHRIVLLEAWGVKKPALIEYDVGELFSKRSHWKFVKWVPPELETTAIVAGKAQEEGDSMFKRKVGLQEAKAGVPYAAGLPILGHIDDPRTEGERIVEVDAWGRLRLCRVIVKGNGGRFLEWIKPDDEGFARVQAARQPKGLIRLNADKISDKKQPSF